MDFSKVSFPLRVYRVYVRPTNFLLLPLLISAVLLVCKQNYVRLNLSLPTAQSTPPQLRLLTFNLPFYPESVSQPNYRKFVIIFYQLYAKDLYAFTGTS
jgi:hypothetical protein